MAYKQIKPQFKYPMDFISFQIYSFILSLACCGIYQRKYGYILDSIFSVLSGHAFHFGLIYSIKSPYNAMKRI